MNSNDFIITLQHKKYVFSRAKKKSVLKILTYFLNTFYEPSDIFWYTVRALIKAQVLQMSYYLFKIFSMVKKKRLYKKEQ